LTNSGILPKTRPYLLTLYTLLRDAMHSLLARNRLRSLEVGRNNEAQCHNKNINIVDPEYLIAERLLKFPLALLDTHVLREVQE